MISPKTFSQFINEANTLNDLRGAAAKATMAGPSREAQSLMSTRTKNILGPEKLSAGISAQQGVETMKSSVPSYTPTPLPTANPTWAKANPTLAAAYAQRQTTRGTQQSNNPLMKDMRSNIPTALPTPTTPTAPPQPVPTTLNPQQQGLYQQAYSNRNNPLAKGRIQSEFSKLTPEQQKAFREYAKSQNHDWGNLI
jgi:hypothetical protein